MKKEKAKKIKKVKIPAVFKKPVDKKRFEKKFLKYIEYKKDKEFFASCFVLTEDKYLIRGDISADEAKKIKELLKWIKKNKKGPVKTVPLAFAGTAAAAVVIFFTTFANPLLSSALERGLEAVFEARADVRGFRLSLLHFEISIRSITVANKNSPMTNLFEMGRTRISLKPQAVLRGRIYIEAVNADDIRFGTPRTVSGALPARPPRERAPREQRDSPPIFDLQNFDAMAILEQEFARLRTPLLYDEVIELYDVTFEKWQDNVYEARAQVEELKTSAQPLLNINMNDFNITNIDDIEGIRRLEANVRSTIQDVNTMVASVQTASDTAVSMVRGIEDDINAVRQLEQNARNAITDDINHFRSFIDLSTGAAFDLIEPVIRDILDDSIEQYIDLGLTALDALEQLRAMAAERDRGEPRPPRERRVRFTGRNVIFPVVSYPRFYLRELTSDFTIDNWNWHIDLRDVSSNPNLTNRPVTLVFGLREDDRLNRSVTFNGNADFRTAATQRFGANIGGQGFPLSLGGQLNRIGIDGFEGETSFSVLTSGYPGGGFSAGASVYITQAQVIQPRGTIASAIGTAVGQAGRVDLGLRYRYNPGERDNFTITTNITDLLNQIVRSIAAEYAQRAMIQLEQALRQKIDEHIAGRFGSREQLDQLLNIARGDLSVIEDIKNSLAAKQNELEQRLRGFADDSIQQLRDEAARQVGAVVDEAALRAEEARLEAERQAELLRQERERVEREAREELERRAEEARQEAERQAEQAARDLIQGQTPSLPGGLRLPGR